MSNNNNIKYSIESVEGNFVARSTVQSFGLDHVTDKDISSYYRKISSQALFDTGLMPLNGTGVLAIRSAGNHTQIAFQHAPQMSYVNWGANEGDRSAVAYHLAQPYRIWIADLLDGNLYGARMFYSPYPISTPEAPLYHLNLPNTNCKGYRGNGVGWICLYHNEDWSNLSFNMKLQKLIERCSGIETYNDANMSETDGPRFYRSHGKPEYVCDPVLWEKKSAEEGIDWTLDPDLWIPVLVQDIDNQDRHYPDGQPLTFAMALLGKYNSYYGDTEHPKLINAFARSDIEIPAKKVFNIFKTSYNAASSNSDSFDQFNASAQEKQKLSQAQFNSLPLFASLEEAESADDNDGLTLCCSCEEFYQDEDIKTYESQNYCENCWDENFIWCENTEEYLPQNHDDLLYMEYDSIWIDSSQAHVEECPNCEVGHWKNLGSDFSLPIYEYIDDQGESHSFCCSCFPEFVDEKFNIQYSISDHNSSCLQCSGWTIKNIPQLAYLFPQVNCLEYSSWGIDFTLQDINNVNNLNLFKVVSKNTCPTHAKTLAWCPSGYWTSNKIIEISPWVSPPFIINQGTDKEAQVVMKITACSSSVYNSKYESSQLNTHPFNAEAYLFRSLTAVALGIAPAFSNYYTLYNLDGTEYSSDPF